MSLATPRTVMKPSGSLLYAGCLLGLGFAFSRQIDEIGAAIAQIGGSALGLIIGLVALYVAYKYLQRQRLLRHFDRLRHGTPAAANRVVFRDLHDETAPGRHHRQRGMLRRRDA